MRAQKPPQFALAISILATAGFVAKAAEPLPVRWAPALIPTVIAYTPKTLADLNQALRTPWHGALDSPWGPIRFSYIQDGRKLVTNPANCAELRALPEHYDFEPNYRNPARTVARLEGQCWAIARAARAVPSRRSYLSFGPRELLDDLAKMRIDVGNDPIDLSFRLLAELGIRNHCRNGVCLIVKQPRIRCVGTTCLVTRVSQLLDRENTFSPIGSELTVTSLVLGDFNGDGIEDLLLSEVSTETGANDGGGDLRYFVVTRTEPGGPLRMLEWW